MRVVHVAPTPFSISGVLGGGERYPLELARALAREVACRLVTFGPWTVGRGRSTVHGLEVQVLPSLGWLMGHPAHPISPGLVWAVRHADVVHVHQMGSLPARLAALAARAWRKPVVVTDLGMPGPTWAGLANRLFDAFLLISAYSAQVLRSPPQRTHVIYGGVDPERFRPATEPRQGVLFVGRLTPHKGVEHLIQALPEGVGLTIAGSEGHDPLGPERGYPAYLRTLAAGREARFITPADDEQLPRLYASARVFCLPSVERTLYGRRIRISELLGLAAIEAMASGTPVVASRVGGLVEVVEDGVTGFLAEPGDPADLRAKLEKLLQDDDLAARMGAAARERALQHFTWQAAAERCLAVYRVLSAEPSAEC